MAFAAALVATWVHHEKKHEPSMSREEGQEIEKKATELLETTRNKMIKEATSRFPEYDSYKNKFEVITAYFSLKKLHKNNDHDNVNIVIQLILYDLLTTHPKHALIKDLESWMDSIQNQLDIIQAYKIFEPIFQKEFPFKLAAAIPLPMIKKIAQFRILDIEYKTKRKSDVDITTERKVSNFLESTQSCISIHYSGYHVYRMFRENNPKAETAFKAKKERLENRIKKLK